MEYKIVNISHNTSPAILRQRDLEINNCDNLIHTLTLQVHFIFKMSFQENIVTTDTVAQLGTRGTAAGMNSIFHTSH